MTAIKGPFPVITICITTLGALFNIGRIFNKDEIVLAFPAMLIISILFF